MIGDRRVCVSVAVKIRRRVFIQKLADPLAMRRDENIAGALGKCIRF
jgi:hypothetical protein